MSPETLRAVLDADAMARAAAHVLALAGAAPGPAVLAWQWIKPGRHFNVCWRFGDDAAAPWVSAFVLSPEQADAAARRAGPHRCGGAPDPACGACATARPAPDLLLQRFPLDYRLPTLPACLDPAAVGAALGSPVQACRLASYRPGMRCQIAYQLADGRVLFGKVAVEREPGAAFAGLQRVHAALRDHPHLRAPAPVAYLPALDLTLAAAARGQSLLAAAPDAASRRRAWRRIARALADLHALPSAGVARVHAPADELALATAWAAQAAVVVPELAAALHDAAARAAATLPTPGPARALVHRDFYDRQVLLDGESAPIAILDLDTVCRGDAELDLGNCAAHLLLRALQEGRPYDAGEAAEFLAAYPAPADPGLVAWYRRATLARLAAIYALRPRWRALVPALCAAAEAER